MLEGDLVLSLNKSASSSDMPTPSDTGSSSSNSEGGSDGEGSAVIIHDGSQSGVIWSVTALPQLSESGSSMMDWTIFPSSGLLPPGKRWVLCDKIEFTRSDQGRALPFRAARQCNRMPPLGALLKRQNIPLFAPNPLALRFARNFTFHPDESELK